MGRVLERMMIVQKSLMIVQKKRDYGQRGQRECEKDMEKLKDHHHIRSAHDHGVAEFEGVERILGED